MRNWLGLIALAAAVAFSAWLRVHVAFRDGLFDGPAEGLLRADPGTLWYLLQAVLAGGGWPDASFATDPRVEHPATVDCWATFTIGHEFLLAGAHALFPAVPLHRLCVIALAIAMSLSAVGVYGLARELTGKPHLGALAAAWFVLTPGAYLTVSFVLMNEDTSWPLFACHLWLAARALRRQSASTAAVAAASAVLAAATWHATTFLLAVEIGSALAWIALSGCALLPRRAALAWLGVLAGASVLVPALRAKGFAFGMPVQLSVAAMLLCAAANRGLATARGARAGVALLTAAGCAGLGVALGAALGTGGEFAHVFELMLAKVRHLGQFPADPSTLSFDARIMWQGPFGTLPWVDLARNVGVPLLPALAMVWLRRRGPPAHAALAPTLALLVVSLPLAWLVLRLQVLPALLAPVVAAVCLQSGVRPRARAWAAAAVLLGAQACLLAQFFAGHRLAWHERVQREETRAAIAAVRDLTQRDAAIAADPVLGGAILAHTGRRIAVQAKWESARSRARLRTLLEPFHRGTVADLHRVLTRDLACDYFFVDRRVLWGETKQMSGFPATQELPLPGTAADAFCTDDFAALRRIPGFKLLYYSPSSITDDFGHPSWNMRLFQVVR